MDIDHSNQARQSVLPQTAQETQSAPLARFVEAARLLFENHGPAVLVLDRSGAVAWSNRQAQTAFAAGYSGRPVQKAGEIQPPQVASRLLSLLQEIDSPGVGLAAGGQGIGRVSGGDLTAYVLEEATGQAAGVMVVSSGGGGGGEQGRIEEIGRLAGFMAHDFNNLLGGILGNASLALTALEDGNSATTNIKAVELAAQRAADLAQQILAYAGSQKVLYASVDLNDIVSEMTGLLEVAIARKAKLRCNLGRGLPAIQANAGQLRQIVLNLISNAAEAAAGPDGQIVVSTGFKYCHASLFQDCVLDAGCSPGGYTWLEVSDNGAGISSSDLARIFEPFYTTKESGQGIGLAAVRSAVIQHGAALEVHSGQGSTAFKVYFPTAGGFDLSLSEEQDNTSNAEVTGVVLIADDEEVIRLVAQQSLADQGFEILTAENGQEAVAMFEEHADKVSVLLVDVSMPQLNGVQVLEAVRKIKPGVPVIMSSGFNEQEAAKHYKLPAGTLFLQKPYMPAALVKKVREALLGS